jgi:hypothetical protein
MIKPLPTAGSTNYIAASIDVGLRTALTLGAAGDAIGRLWELVGLSIVQAELPRNHLSEVALVQLGGLEPPTSCSTDRRSNQLSYNCILAGAKKGAEPDGN